MALAVAVAKADHLHQVLIVHSSPAFSAEIGTWKSCMLFHSKTILGV